VPDLQAELEPFLRGAADDLDDAVSGLVARGWAESRDNIVSLTATGWAQCGLVKTKSPTSVTASLPRITKQPSTFSDEWLRI
jgi:hypothetical protein